MKRREFLGAPAALLALGLVDGIGNTAAAANALTFTLLRLAGSGGEADITGAWQQAWPQAPADLRRARVIVRGVVPASPSTLGAVTIESAFFGAKNDVNLAKVYSVLAGRDSGSRAISFQVDAATFGGLVVTPLDGARSAAATSIALGDSRTGALTAGRYVLLQTGSRRINVADLLWTGYDDRPLRRRDGRAIDTDYIAFDVEPA